MYKLHTYVRFTRQFVHPSRAGKKANERKVEGNNWYLNTILFFGESNIGTQDETAAWTEAIDIKSKFLDCLGIVVGPTIVWVELPQKLQCFALHLITFPLTLKPFHLSSDKKNLSPIKRIESHAGSGREIVSGVVEVPLSASAWRKNQIKTDYVILSSINLIVIVRSLWNTHRCESTWHRREGYQYTESKSH